MKRNPHPQQCSSSTFRQSKMHKRMDSHLLTSNKNLIIQEQKVKFFLFCYKDNDNEDDDDLEKYNFFVYNTIKWHVRDMIFAVFISFFFVILRVWNGISWIIEFSMKISSAWKSLNASFKSYLNLNGNTKLYWNNSLVFHSLFTSSYISLHIPDSHPWSLMVSTIMSLNLQLTKWKYKYNSHIEYHTTQK